VLKGPKNLSVKNRKIKLRGKTMIASEKRSRTKKEEQPLPLRKKEEPNSFRRKK